MSDDKTSLKEVVSSYLRKNPDFLNDYPDVLETLACGSGACAAMAILHQAGRVGNVVDVFLPGGHLVIKWRGNQEPLTMKGPAEHVFRGNMNE